MEDLVSVVAGRVSGRFAVWGAYFLQNLHFFCVFRTKICAGNREEPVLASPNDFLEQSEVGNLACVDVLEHSGLVSLPGELFSLQNLCFAFLRFFALKISSDTEQKPVQTHQTHF